jgi:hypothetical protein
MTRILNASFRPSIGMGLLGLLALLMLSSGAQAEFIGQYTVTVNATSDAGVSEYSIKLPDPPHEGDRVSVSLDEPAQLKAESGALLAELRNLEVTLDGDPAVDLSFAVTSGNSDTTFTITSAVVGFPAIDNPFALASVGFTLTDTSPIPGNGAYANIVAPNAGLYQATYNSGTNFADLLGSVNLVGSGTVVAEASSLADGEFPKIMDSVTDIQAQLKFTLSADDQASGSSRFEVSEVPEPVSIQLLILGFAGFLIARRRRAV